MASVDASDGRGRGVSIGHVLGRSVGVIRDNPVVLLGLSFLLGAVPQGVLTLLGAAMVKGAVTGTPGGLFGAAIGLGVIGFLLYLVVAILLQGALIRASMAYAEGRRAGVGECLSTGLRTLLPLLGLGFLLTLGIGFGMLLLIVPGIILLLCWSVAAPVLVEEGVGISAALRRSVDLTRGARWRILGLILVVGGAVILASIGIEVASSALGQEDPFGTSPARLAADAVLATIISALSASVPAILYVDLRRWKEGAGTAELADVFA